MKRLRKALSYSIAGISLFIFIVSILIMIVGIRAIKQNELLYLFNYSFSVVADTKSMEGNLKDSLDGYDVAIIRKASYDEIKIGDIIVFNNRSDGRLVIHRVVGEHPLGGFETKGDANQNVDPHPVTKENFQGIYHAKITFLKPIARLATESRSAIFGLIALVLLILLISEMINIFKEIHKQKLAQMKLEHDQEIERIRQLEIDLIQEDVSIKKSSSNPSDSID